MRKDLSNAEGATHGILAIDSTGDILAAHSETPLIGVCGVSAWSASSAEHTVQNDDGAYLVADERLLGWAMPETRVVVVVAVQ